MARSTEDRVLRSGDNRSHVTMEALDTGLPSEDDEKTTDDACGQGNSFSPLFLISEWNETFTTRKCLSVAVNLPSGTHQNYQLAIVDSSATLQLRVHWPAAMGDVKTLHHLWLVVEEGRRVSRDHAKLGDLRRRSGKNEHPQASLLFLLLLFASRSLWKRRSPTSHCTGATQILLYCILTSVQHETLTLRL